MKILGMEVRFDKDCPPNRLLIMNPQFTQAVDVISGVVYDFKKGKWRSSLKGKKKSLTPKEER